MLSADLTNANLKYANLLDADLTDTNLKGANLIKARGVTDEQLASAKSLKSATMPDGTKHK